MKSSDKALQEFFTALLDEPEAKVDSAPLQKLLDGVDKPKVETVPQQVTPTEQPVVSEPVVTKPESVARIIAPAPVVAPTERIEEPVVDVQSDTDVAPQTAPANSLTEAPPVPDEEFQALYFEVAGMTLAVPLEQLGGIHNLDEEQVSNLIGKPSWFRGLLAHRERKLNVVDTALWVMPEKYDDKLAEQLNYQYLVMLKDSNWGLACERLITTSQLMPSAVNWRTTMGKRPWLRGMVKEQMCALLNVDALIELLNTGMNSQQANNPE
ncbi:chemotaxis protein CheW [Neiella marina]|uniref:Chemotaxis protein CheW n=1 Tax=Neiella holothuriorum TaxID=2870530 RepID=A0ABS7EG48_9GAMM|nr:chemotaxis protein CheW [Neiella holothuriorum]MBW8190781.1 chemotaxis protein CheW [Neiella holothuriorum]